ncbi:MAG: polysaccharide deacetylase family protein [Lutibacter sp.]|jgi:peptidoglycan/xylan/chitin deacetylase (PgdA/CDA1 family)
MKFYLIKTPRFIKFIFNNWIWCFSAKEKVIYLTFDDGPTPGITDWVLNELKKYEAKATFFCIGKNIEKYRELFQRIIEEKHSVGNHTNNHLNGWETITEDYLKNIEDAEKYFEEGLGLSTINSKIFRPPYGKLKLSQAKQIRKKGYKIVMWDVLSADFDVEISKEKCLENVVRNIQNGSVVVFHDSVKAAEKLKFILPQVLEYYTSKGFAFKRI